MWPQRGLHCILYIMDEFSKFVSCLAGDSSDDEVWYTAEEGSFDESTGSYVCLAKEEDASKKTISANKLDLTFSIPEVHVCRALYNKVFHYNTFISHIMADKLFRHSVC